MRAVVYEAFGARPEVRDVPDPAPSAGQAVVAVEATGLCRSDWHAWSGHDASVRLPHVPGHELAGTVAAVGSGVERWAVGDRVTVPFVCACGTCAACASGNQQVCLRQAQPGFTHWGSFAEQVVIERADVNLVRLPERMSFETAAILGCRFATAFRAVVAQGGVVAGRQVAVFGCGGVGLSAVMIAAACGARVVAVDVSPGALELAAGLGAAACIDASATGDVAAAVRDRTGGGVDVSLDALGSPRTCVASIESLRWRGRHVQVGLLAEADGGTALPMTRVVAQELEVVGSHGMPAHGYGAMLGMVEDGTLRPDLLITRRIGLEEAPGALAAMGGSPAPGVTVIFPD